MAFSRLPLNDFDISGITNEVTRWQKNRHQGSYDISSANSGNASLTLEDPFRSSGFFKLDIWKYGEKKILGWKKAWVAEVSHGVRMDGDFESRGFVGAAMLAKLLTDTTNSMRSDYYPFKDFGSAVNTYLLR
jgi:hypothetical protein